MLNNFLNIYNFIMTKWVDDFFQVEKLFEKNKLYKISGRYL